MRADHDHEHDSDALRRLRDAATELRMLRDTGELLYWDDRMSRPEAAATWRAGQRALLASLVHERTTSTAHERIVAAAEDAHPGHAEPRVMRADIERARRAPVELWSERERAASIARAAWDDARAQGSAEAFVPALEAMVDAVRRLADEIGYEHEPYEACLDEWEPGMDVATVERLLEALREQLAPVRARLEPARDELARRPFAPAAMHEVERRAVLAVGFDPSRGMLVPSVRAFCLPLGPDDVRMTSRFHDTPGIRGIHSSLHEAGHAIYAQSFGRLGVPATLAAAPGLGIDESQSRLVENAIGRSPSFVAWLHRQLTELAPEAFGGDAGEVAVLARELIAGERATRRLGADEATYDLHVLVRFRIERALVNGQLRPAELAEAWDAEMQDVLGVRPADDLDGCLQDVHWSLGQWGYFPTYTLGNVYGAQLLERAHEDLGDLDAELEATGDTHRLRAWMDAHVYRAGRAMQGRELVEHVTGRPLSADPLVRHVTGRYAPG